MRPSLVRWGTTLALAVSVGLTACGGTDPQKSLASAKAFLEKGELKSAVIELKTTLQQNPDSAEARFLLGSALLASEEPIAATVELRKAIELKLPRDVGVPELARALLAQGKYKDVVAEFGELRFDNKRALSNLRTSVGLAHSRSGNGSSAMAAFKEAIDLDPDSVPAQNGFARQLAVSGQRDEAVKVIESIVAKGKADADTLVLQGDLLAYLFNDKAGAIKAYRGALALDERHFIAHSNIIQILVGSGDAKGAAAQVAELHKVRPRHPATRYFQAQVAHLQGDNKSAKELILQLLKGAPDHPQFNQLAGSIELASGSSVAARTYLNKALHAAPQSVIARRLLASVHLRSGEAPKALQLLQPMLMESSQDAVALSLAGQAYLQSGDLEKANEMFAQAARINPSNAANLTALAKTRFLKGDVDGAVADLQQIAAADTGTVADLELITTQMRRRDFVAAIKAIDALERKQPDKPLTAHLRGAAYTGLRDTASARSNFERALALDPTYFPAAFSLAALDQAAKKPQDAQQRFESILKIHPGHLRALLALADLRTRSGAPKPEVTNLLTSAVRQNQDEASAHLSLINNLLVNKQSEAALAAAQQADLALPGQPQILDALGLAQVAAGQPNQALATFNKVIALQPGNPLAHMRVADVKMSQKDTDAAAESLRRALAAKADALQPMQRLLALEVHRGRHAEAIKLARDLQKRQPAHSLGFVFEGDTLRAQKSDAAALAVYRVALTKAGSEIAAPRVHGLLAAMRKGADADQFAKSWMKDHPKDLSFTVYLGDNALARRDFAGAETAFRRAIEIEPNHAASLNNIAWLMVKTNKPGALPFAQKANELMPNQPAMMDTMALALAGEKRVEEALELQKKALGLAPTSNVLRLNLARLHIQAGQKPEAREILDSLTRLGDALAEQGEVRSLLAGL